MDYLVALIRGINVGSTRKLPMADLRTACAEAGLGEARTYIQSGNVVLPGGDPTKVEMALQTLVADRFGLDVPVIVRTAAQWSTLIETCPLAQEAKDAPKALHLLACKKPPVPSAIEALRERAKHGETILPWGDEIAVHFANGVADSKLTPSLIDRLVGSPTTARNWNTVLQLDGMTRG